MKTLLAILGAAALVAALMGTNFAGINPGASEGSIDATLGTGFVAGNRVTDNPVPIIAVRIDDGRDDLVSMAPGVALTPADQGYYGVYWPYLKAGIPVTLALHYDLLGNVGRATVADIQRIIAEFDSAGVAIEIAQHTDGTRDFNNTMTYADFVDEIDPSELRSALGVPVVSFATPGDTDFLNYLRHDRESIISVMKDSGIKYWDSEWGNSSVDSIRVLAWSTTIGFDGATNPQNTAGREIYPGVTDDPYRLPVAQTVDLENYFVERFAGTGYDAWTIAADGSGDPKGDWEKSFTRFWSDYVASGYGGVWAVHDSVSSDATYPGAFSHHRVAEVLSDLRNGGYIRLGTVKEVYEWGVSKWAPGTFVINSQMKFPAFDIGDSAGVEIAWMDGLGSIGVGVAAWDGSNTQSTGSFDAAAVGAKYDRAGDHPVDHSVAGQGWKSQGNAFYLTGTNNRFTIVRTGLQPGRYEFSFASSGSSIDVRDFTIAAVGKYQKFKSVLDQGFAAYGDTLLMLYDAGLAAGASTHSAGAVDKVYTFNFEVSPQDIIQRLPNNAGTAGQGWTQDAAITNYGARWWLNNWQGGIYVQFEPGSTSYFSRVKLRYIGPLKY